MNKLLALPLLLTLIACGEEPAPAPQPAPTATVASPTANLPPPALEVFSEVYAAACPDAPPVNVAVCRRAGLGSPEVVCEYGLGEDEYLRNRATLVAADGAWTLSNPAEVCAAS